MQLLLTIFAVLLSCYILFKAMMNRKRKNRTPETACVEETIQTQTDPLMQDFDLEWVKNEPPQEEQPKKVTRDFIAFTITPKQQDFFPGRLLLATLKANGFYLGEQNLFQQHVDEDPTKPIMFSVASLIEPGIFHEEEMIDSNFPGLLIYMVLSKAFDPLVAFEKMLKNVRIIAAALHGEILDSEQHLLTSQIISACRNTIKEYMLPTPQSA